MVSNIMPDVSTNNGNALVFYTPQVFVNIAVIKVSPFKKYGCSLFFSGNGLSNI